MKKLISILLIALLCFSLVGCAKTYQGYDGLIEKAREEIPISEASTTEIKIAGSIDMEDGTCLVWFVTGNEYQAHYYAPIEFKQLKKNDDKYEFVKIYKPLDRGDDIAVLNWKRGSAFIVNNSECVAVRITDDNGTHEEQIGSNKYPWIFYCESIPTEYVFLDTQGNELR